MTDWQDISTAPKDGIAGYLVFNGNRVFLAWLDDDGWHDATNQDYDDIAEDPQPTHWQPLPRPPK